MPYAIAALATAAAFLLRLLLAPALGTDAPLLAFMFAVMVAGWYGGLAPALLATAVSALLGVLFFIPPTYDLALPDTADRVNALVFLGIGAITSWLTESLHRARERAAESAAGERASEERYRLLVDAVQDYAIVLLDPEGRIASWNSGAERIQGYHADEILGRHVSLFYPPDQVERGEPERHIARALSAGRAEYEAWRVRKNGSRFWANVVLTPIRDEAQGVRGFVKVTRDITERKQTEDALRESAEALRDREAQMSGIIGAAMDAIVTVDADQRVRAFNVAAEAMFGYRAAEILGEPLSRLLPDRFHGAHQGHVRGFGRSGTTSRSMGSLGALMGRRADGTEFPIEASISQVAVGGKALYTAIVRDITERERARKALHDAYEREHRIAAGLQESLLLAPPEDKFPGLALATFYEAAWDEASMGGDFFDVFALPGGRVAVVIGDASGKGLAAAIRTTEIKYALRVFLRETASPGVALERVNRFVYEARALEQREGNAFLVLSVMVIDLASGRAEFAAAGAEPPLLFRADGSSEAVDAGGVPLGILPDEAYASAERRLAQGDTVLFVTDGITEARRGDRFFWENGLTGLASDVLQGMPLRRAGQAILDGARAFAGGTLQDDACLLVVQRRDPPPA